LYAIAYVHNAKPNAKPTEKDKKMTTQSTVSLKRIVREVAVVDIKGTAPLIVHRWSEKARTMMLDAQQGRKTPKQLKDPQADYDSSMYKFEDGSAGFPVMAFKSATVKGGGRLFGKAVKMTELRQLLIFLANGVGTDGTQLVSIQGEPTMREDMVRVGMGTADIRYRAEYRDWTAQLRIEFVPSVIDIDSVVALVDAGGTNGIGEWRPEKSGSYGTYEVI
jgi:hypothetical protein